MKKRILAFLLVAFSIFYFTGCNTPNSAESRESEEPRVSTTGKPPERQYFAGDIGNDAAGHHALLAPIEENDIGTTRHTEWFDFTVLSVKMVGKYAGYIPPSGTRLIDVLITETNTDDKSLPMGTFDFYLNDPADENNYKTPLSPLDETMMPEEFTLHTGKTVTYHLLFEVDESSSGYVLYYEEYYTDSYGNEGIGQTFAVHLGY